VHLGLTKKEFLRMSPREFHAMTKCYQEREERMDRRFATMMEIYAKCHGVELTADDFMGKDRDREHDDKVLEQSLTALFGCGPGFENGVKVNG
jgi:hypothetical protein